MTDREKLIKLLCEANSKSVDAELFEDSSYAQQLEMEADFLIANGVTVQQWIPVTERLPSEEEYTATSEDGTEYYARFLIAYKTDIVEYEIGYYDGYKWMTEMPIRLIKDVVAWMLFPNLPEPPKGE